MRFLGKVTATFFILLAVFLQVVFAFEVRAVTDAFTSKNVSEFPVQFEDSYFDESAFEYNHKLAQASLGMALSAFRPTVDKTIPPNEHLILFLNDCGFTDLRSDDYDKEPSSYTVSTVIGRKNLTDQNGESYTLLAVGICGGGYSNEWLSNFSIGGGVRHEGFDNAAHLVFNRILGYIGRLNIQGRVKVWVSGFSRAAAISNITAADLVDCGVFRQEDIFAYTFATPRTTREPHDGEYDNIFNIVGQYDIVPQVPLSAWGFERYGKMLYTPLLETDSDFHERAGRADKISLDFTGQHFWVNVPVNFRLHQLLGYVFYLCPTQEDYVAHLQEPIKSMFENRSLDNILHQLAAITEDGKLVNDENREIASELLDFVFVLVINSLTDSGQISSMWNADTSFTANLLHEHTQDVYLSWVLSSENPEEIFTANTDYTRLSVFIYSDDSKLTVTEGESNVLFTIKGDDNVGDYSFDGGIYVTKSDDQIVFILPHDRDLRVWYQQDDDGDMMSYAKIWFDTDSIGESEIVVGYCRGPEKTLIYTTEGQVSEHLEEVSVGASDFDENSKYLPPYVISSVLDDDASDMGWRETIFYSLIFPLVVFLIAFVGLIVIIKFATRSHFSVVPVIVGCILLVLIILEELFFWLYRSDLPRNMSKGAIGLLLLGFVAWGLLRWKKAGVLRTSEGKYMTVIGVCVLLFAIADVVIDYSIPAGIVFFAIVHLNIVVVNLIRRRLSAYQWLGWAVMSIVFGFVIIGFVNIDSSLKLPFIIYACVVSMLVVSSHNMPTTVAVGSGLLMVSDCMMGFYHSIHDILLLHVVYNLIYYAAMFCFAYACFRHKDISMEKKELAAEEAKANTEPVT